MRVVLRSDCSHRAFAALALGVLTFLGGASCTKLGALPRTEPPLGPMSAEQAAIEKREVCVGSTVHSAGELADALYYRATVLPGGKLVVGYFAFFSEERPWGNNWLTWTVVPAAAVDMVYTRALFFGPGLQRALSGKGDVEGFRIQYAMHDDGSLEVEHAEADDGTHKPVRLDAAEILALDPERPTLYTDVWSHQLGGRGARSKSDLAYVHCFGPGRVRPLPDAIAAEFTLDSGRAPPAHVETLGGQPVGPSMQASAQGAVPATEM